MLDNAREGFWEKKKVVDARRETEGARRICVEFGDERAAAAGYRTDRTSVALFIEGVSDGNDIALARAAEGLAQERRPSLATSPCTCCCGAREPVVNSEAGAAGSIARSG